MIIEVVCGRVVLTDEARGGEGVWVWSAGGKGQNRTRTRRKISARLPSCC